MGHFSFVVLFTNLLPRSFFGELIAFIGLGLGLDIFYLAPFKKPFEDLPPSPSSHLLQTCNPTLWAAVWKESPAIGPDVVMSLQPVRLIRPDVIFRNSSRDKPDIVSPAQCKPP